MRGAAHLLGALPIVLIFTTAAAPRDRSRPEKPIAFPEIQDWKSLKILLGRSPCFGTCPVYEVTIDGEGNVVYEGRAFVAVKGVRRAKVSVETAHSLFAQFKAAQFFWLFDGYRAPYTDLPTYLVSISFDGHTKKVFDYAGLNAGMPKQVDDLEQEIDRVAGTAKWIEGAAKQQQKAP